MNEVCSPTGLASQVPESGFPVIAEITLCYTFEKKSIMQVIAANILMRTFVVKVVCECFLP